MRMDVSTFMLGASLAPRVELVLRRPDGSPWSLIVSPGVECFIGYYPRLDGFDGGGPLLEYSLLPTR
jgi:hypothetical protein